MWNKSNFWSINTMCEHYIASELHRFLPHLFTMLYSVFMLFNYFFTADSVWKTGDSSEHITLQDCFTAAFEEVEQTEKYKFLSIYVPCHKKKKLHASLVFKTLNIQLYDSSVNIVRLASKNREILSWFVFASFYSFRLSIWCGLLWNYFISQSFFLFFSFKVAFIFCDSS